MKDSWLHFSRAVLLCAIVSGLLALSGCSRSDAPDTASTTKISGVVQKGPFLPGGKITARPLQPGLPSQPLPDAPTIEGKLGSNGSYELELPWSGPTELKVTGLFHDELAREESKRRTTLSATADVQDDEQLNVNLFTTLTHNRTLALLADDEDNYQDAVTTAHRELSDLLDLDLPDADAIRHLDLTDRTDPELQDANSNLLLFSATVLHEYSVIIPTDADDDEEDDDALPGLRGFIRDFSDDGRINGIAHLDWERMINVATLDLLEDAEEGLITLGHGDNLPADKPSLPGWAGRLIVSLHDPSYVIIDRQLELHVPVRLSASPEEEVRVRFSIEPGTAIAGTDYLDPALPEDGLLRFAPGEQLKTIKIPLIPAIPIRTGPGQDNPINLDGPIQPQAPKTFELVLTDPEGARFGRDRLQTAVPVEHAIVRDDLKLISLKLAKLHDGRREIPLSGQQIYARDGLLTASLLLESSIDCPDSGKILLGCTTNSDFGFFAEVALVSGADNLPLGLVYVNPNEIIVGDAANYSGRRPPIKGISMIINGPRFDSFVAEATEPLEFRVTTKSNPTQRVSASAPKLAPYDNVLNISSISTTELELSSATPTDKCPGISPRDNLWLIAGASNWRPGRGNSWGEERIHYDEICAELKQINGRWEFQLLFGQVHVDQLTGYVGNLPVIAQGNLLDRTGARFPKTIMIELPAEHSWHEVESDGRPKPRGSQHITIQTSSNDRFMWPNDYAGLQVDISSGYIHARGLPFSMQAQSLSLSPEGLSGTIQRFHYNFDQGYRQDDPRHSDLRGPISNDSRFANPITAATEFYIDNEGLHIPELIYPTGSARTHYPRVQVQWDRQLTVAIVAGRIQEQTLPGSETYRFDFAGNCSGCADGGAEPTSYNLSTISASGLGSDGAIVAKVNGLPDPAWGPKDNDNDRRIFQRSGDNDRHGIFYLPGLIAEGSHDGWVVDYLLGARSIDAIDTGLLPGKVFSRTHSETLRGNNFFAGLTVGPETYSDSQQQPQQPLVGSDLSDTSLDIGFGGVNNPDYRVISNNLATKYVVRPGGLTGVFNSDDKPGYINVYDYNIALNRFAIRMVNNQLDSYNWLDGELHVPGKGDFKINFASLELGCSGDVGAGRIDHEACDGSGSCGARLAAWQAPAELISMAFKPEDPAASMCLAQQRRLEVVQSLELTRLTKPFGLRAFWSPGGDLLEHTISSAGDQQIDKPSDSPLDGFALVPSDMQLKTRGGGDSDGWLQFHGLIGAPFWEAIKVDGRVANKDYRNGNATPAPTVLVAEGKLTAASEGCDNSSFILDGDCGGNAEDLLPKASYRWGNTSWGFSLPIEYDFKAVDKGELPRFLGVQRSINLLVLDANAGVNFIDPERTRLSFGASADFARLRSATEPLELQIDLGDPDTLRAIDSLLDRFGVRGSPLQTGLGNLQERLDLMNNLVGPALENAIKRAVLEGITRVGGEVTGGDPFEQLADAMSLVQTLPAQIANTVGDHMNTAMDHVTAPLIGPVDDALVSIYENVPRIIEEAPDNPTGELVERIRAQLQQLRHAHRALNQVDSAIAVAAGGLGDVRNQVNGLHNQVTGWKTEIDQALNMIQSNILDIGLKLGECGFTRVDGKLTSRNALIGPALDSLARTKEVASILRGLEIAQDIGVPIATLADLDPEPIQAAERQIHDLAQAIEQRADQVLQAAEDALCPSGDDHPITETLTKANNFLDEIRRGMMTIEQQINSVHSVLNEHIDQIDDFLQAQRQHLATGHTFLENLDDTLQAMLDGIPNYDYKNWTVQQVQATMDQVAQDAFGLPWYDPGSGTSFVAPLVRQLRQPIDAQIIVVQNALQQQLATVAGHVPVKSADELRNMVSNYVLDTPPVQQLLSAVNTHMSAITEELNGLITLAVDQVNYLVQGAVRELEARANEVLAAASAAVEDLPMFSAGMDGYAVISGEELERLHLSAEWTMSGSADENTTSYNAALDITSWNVNGKAEGCMAGAEDTYGSLMDATISTRNLPISIGPEEMLIRKLYLGFTLEDLKPKGVFGGIDTQGDLDFEAFTLYDIAFAAGVGARENYIGASAGATFSSLQMSAAFLVGKTCNLEVLESLDPQVAQFITLPGGVFNGAYARGSASVPIWENGCALRVGVAADVGAWVLISPNLTIGGLVGGGAFGKVACLGALRGQVTAMGEKSGSSFSFAGEGFGVAGAGLKCKPETWTTLARSRENSWCGTVDASFGARYSDGWQLDGVKFSGIH